MEFTDALDVATDIANAIIDDSVPPAVNAPPTLNDCMYQTGLHDGTRLAASHPAAVSVGHEYDHSGFTSSLEQAQQSCGLPPAQEPPPIHIPSLTNPALAFFEVALAPTEANWTEPHDLMVEHTSGLYAAGFDEGTGHSALERAYQARDAIHGYIDLGPPDNVDMHLPPAAAPHPDMFDSFIDQYNNANFNVGASNGRAIHGDTIGSATAHDGGFNASDNTGGSSNGGIDSSSSNGSGSSPSP